MRIDLSLRSTGARVDELVAAASTAEEAGLDGVWLYDHLSGSAFGADRSVDVWVGLTAIATATSRVTIGPLVLNAAIRHPARIAVAAATLQELSGGRLRLGLGAGSGPGDPFADELVMLGLPVLGAAERRGRVADTIGYLRALWDGEGSYAGRLHRFDEPTGVLLPDPSPPIIVAASGPKMATLAAEHADGVNLHDFRPGIDRLAAIARERAAAGFEVSVEGPDATAWLDPADPTAERMVAAGFDRVMLRWSPPDGLDVIRRLGPAA